jgi:hypothetical protein
MPGVAVTAPVPPGGCCASVGPGGTEFWSVGLRLRLRLRLRPLFIKVTIVFNSPGISSQAATAAGSPEPGIAKFNGTVAAPDGPGPAP